MTPEEVTEIHDGLRVWQGRQYAPDALPAGVDSDKLPTLTEWLADNRVLAVVEESEAPKPRKKKKS